MFNFAFQILNKFLNCESILTKLNSNTYQVLKMRKQLKDLALYLYKSYLKNDITICSHAR